jgi:hypothetical protein
LESLGRAINNYSQSPDQTHAQALLHCQNDVYLAALFLAYQSASSGSKDDQTNRGNEWRDWIDTNLNNSVVRRQIGTPAPKAPEKPLERGPPAPASEHPPGPSGNPEPAGTPGKVVPETPMGEDKSQPGRIYNPDRRTFSIELIYYWSPLRITILISLPLIASLLVGTLYAHMNDDIVAAWTISLYIVTCILGMFFCLNEPTLP